MSDDEEVEALVDGQHAASAQRVGMKAIARSEQKGNIIISKVNEC